MQKIRVLCVDDSALVRGLMTEIINSQPDMEVVATAPDPLVARELIKKHNPDVLTLDVEMPRMDGLDFLEKLMRLRPMPVVMVSTLTARGADATIRALELGAFDCYGKPGGSLRAAAHGKTYRSGDKSVDKPFTASGRAVHGMQRQKRKSRPEGRPPTQSQL